MDRARTAAVLVFGGAIVAAASVAQAQPAPGASASTWQMPWQILPAALSSKSAGETMAWVPGTGFVRATPAVMATIGQPLSGRPGMNPTVQACRATVQSEAGRIGATEIEAVSAGAARLNRFGQWVGPVEFRITYGSPTGYEIRSALMTCVVDRSGRIVDAFVSS